MKQIRLSIVMCTYNGAAYLQPQLDSLLAQTRLPDQVILADDGSSDATVDIVQSFVKQAQDWGIDVQLHRNPVNLGYVENFASALGRATGDVLFLCDQDDVWRADKLALMAACFEGDPQLLLLHSDARLVDARGDGLGCSLFDALELTSQEKQAIHQGRAFEVVLRRSFVTGATAALRRQVVDMMLPVPTGWIHDEWLAAVVAACGRMDFIDQPLIDYRQHGGNQIGMSKRTLAMKWRDLRLPRSLQLAAEAMRLQQLEDFLARSETACAIERAAQVRHKRVHFEQRVALGRLPRPRRLSLIVAEARAGCYRRYGTGGRSILRDLLRHD